MTTTVTQTLERARTSVEQHNTLENRAYLGATSGVVVAYLTSGGLIGGAVGGAAGVVAYPIYYDMLGEDKSKTERVAKAALLSFATAYVAPSVILYALGTVSIAVIGIAIPVVIIGGVVYTQCPELTSQLAKIPGLVNKLLKLV